MTSQSSSSHGKFILVLCCIDGRNTVPIWVWVSDKFPGFHLDTVTAPGLDGILAGTVPGQIAMIKEYADVSMEHHHPEFVIVSGHEDCAGNPVSRQQHIEDIRASVETVRSWGGKFADIPIYGLYVERNDKGEWVVGECVTGNIEV